MRGVFFSCPQALERGEGARRAAQGELVNYLRARGVAGAETEIIATVQERLAQVESAMASPLAEAWATAADWFPSLDFRPAVRNVTSVLCPGPERQEVELRYRWRKRADSCRLQTLKGGAHRRGGAKRRGPERVGHNGGAMARAMRAKQIKDAFKKPTGEPNSETSADGDCCEAKGGRR